MIGFGLNGKAVPNAIWPTDNEFDIPVLNTDFQANALDLPFLIWGSVSRQVKNKGTWAFYTDDYRFTSLWKSPEKIIASGCVNCVEMNYTITNQTPFPEALYSIYRKRWLARYWQEFGKKRIFVDMNIGMSYSAYNLLGVPSGWKAYSSRAYKDKLDDLLYEYHLAQQHADSDDFIFVVYGGGIEAQYICRHHKCMIWINDHKSASRGATHVKK